MAENGDLEFARLFRVIFMQGGQVAIGTAIGAGVLLLVGILAVLLSPVLVPILLFRYWRQEKARAAGQPQDVTDLVGGGGQAPPRV